MKRAPRRNRRIYFEIAYRTPDGAGGFVKEWTQPTPIAAAMEPVRGERGVEHQVLEQRQLWKVTIRYRRDVDADCRMVHDGAPLAMIGAPHDPDGTRRWLVMTCESGVRG